MIFQAHRRYYEPADDQPQNDEELAACLFDDYVALHRTQPSTLEIFTAGFKAGERRLKRTAAARDAVRKRTDR